MSDYYAEPEPEPLGDPALDPPMTVRHHPDDNPRDPKARRVIRSDQGVGRNPGNAGWTIITGDRHWFSGLRAGLYHHEVADWPVSHGFLYSVAFRHAEAAAARRGDHAQAADRGDMDLDAFRGGA